MSNKNLIASLIAFGMAVWLFSGELGSNIVNADEAPEAGSNTQEIPYVRARKSEAQIQQITLGVSGQTRANRTVEIKSEVSGRIEQIPAVKGTVVKEGDLLCKIAVDTRQSELDQARAALKSAKLEYDGLLDLKRQGLQSNINVAKAEANLAATEAIAKAASLALEKTQLVAPFAGVIEQQAVEIGDFLNVGQTCVTLIEIDPILVVGQLAEKSINAVQIGDLVQVELITGQRLEGELSFIARSPNATTRTYPIEVTVHQPGENIRAGLSAEMRVPTGRKSAHLISSAAMVLNDEGKMGVRIVDDNNVVHFKPINIVSESPEGVWITGLPDSVNLITVGQEDVFEGQTVRMELAPLNSVSRSFASTTNAS